MQIDPVAFRLFGIDIYWYGIMISLGMLAGVWVGIMRTKYYGISEDELFSFALFAVPTAVVCTRLAFVVANWHLFAGNWRDIFNLRQGGLAIHGGIIGGILACLIFTKVKKISFWRLADLCAPALIIGQAIGRWGNFFNQEAYGIPTDLPWAMFIDGAYRHPVFLYESLWNLVVFAYLIYVTKKETASGGIFARYLIGYSLGRFFIEGVRADTLFWGSLRAGQVVSVILIAVGLVVLWWRKRYGREDRKGET